MKLNANQVILITFGIIINVKVFASPTEGELDHCRRITVKSLEHCLNDNLHYKSINCWKLSHDDYNDCMLSVDLSHLKHSKRIVKERVLEEQVTPNQKKDSRLLNLGDTTLSFQKFISDFRQAVIDKNIAIIHGALAKDFDIERDFGGVYNSKATPEENFSFCYQLDNSKLLSEYKDTGWAELEIILSGDLFESVGVEICAPYGARDNKPLPQEQLCFREVENDQWRISRFVSSGD